MSTTPSPTQKLAEFVAGLDISAVPEGTRRRVKNLLLDALASALAGWHGDETLLVLGLARSLAGAGSSPVIGGEPLSPAGAALVNGYLITATTVCDVYRPALCHVTPEVVPPALAITASRNPSGAELLVALAAGLEVTTRVGLGTDYPVFRRHGWHSPGVIGPFGGAAAAGRLLGLDTAQMRNAFGLAGSQSAGTFAHWGTATIKFHQSRGALSGLIAALLAAEDFESAPEVLANPDGGIFHAYAEGGRPEEVTRELGERWELEQIALRLWPLASSIQSVATALFALIEKHDIRPEHISEVGVRLGETVYDMHGTLPWDVRFRALLSTPYATAVILHDRACWIDQFTTERIADPALGDFARDRVRVIRDPRIKGTAATVEMTLLDGAELVEHREVPRGDAADPLSVADVEGKFRLAAKDRLEASAVETILRTVSDLERVTDLREFVSALQSGARQSFPVVG
jgi:2-methylcitrate dehydratase PrpD